MPKKRKINLEKGSISVYAIATVFCFIFILSGVFTSSSSIRKNQLKTLLKIKEIYASQIDKADEIAEKRRLDSQKVANNLGIVISTTENTDLTDNYGNKITIPAGFHIVTTTEDSTVEYSYSEDGIPAVQDGIVVADGDGNQFVWIPVGIINNKDGATETTNTIELARYTFNTDGTIVTKITDGNTLTDEGGLKYLEEISTSTNYANTKAKDIEEFTTNATIKGGYYIARYEASYRDGTKPSSKKSTGTPDITDGSTIAEGMLWNWITESDAAIASRAMYEENNYFVSDLINSYAWDTTIVFIQTYSGDTDYSIQTSLNSTLGNTGERNDEITNTTDNVCNIYDMASNASEWTTETSTDTDSPYVVRGGEYSNNSYYTSYRNTYSTSSSNISFRPLLYVK